MVTLNGAEWPVKQAGGGHPVCYAASRRMTRAIVLAYRVFFDGFLSRLPEERAIALGQAFLRVVPLDRLPLFRLDDPRLAITLGGVRLPNPLILAAMYHDRRLLHRAMGLGFGAVTTKSITLAPRPGHPRPNLVRVRTAAGPGLVNCNGFENPGLDAFRVTLGGLPHRVPVIASVAGESPEDYVTLIRGLAPLADLVEMNVSSPNTRLVYEWSRRPRELRELLERARAASPVPLIVKLSPDFEDANERDIIPAAIEAGVGILDYGNTHRVEEPRLSQRAGGLSGPELYRATVEHVRRTRARFGRAVQIIATGGIDSPDKALRLLSEGADALGYFTGFITRGPALARLILETILRGR